MPNDHSPSSGRFFTHFGPETGPVAIESPALGVLAEPAGAIPIGVAYPIGDVDYRGGIAKTFRLVVNKVVLGGQWICVGREFIPLGEAAEDPLK